MSRSRSTQEPPQPVSAGVSAKSSRASAYAGRSGACRHPSVHRVSLAPRVRDEQVGQAVPVVVGGGDPHPGVGVRDAGAHGHVPQAEAEARRIRGDASRPGLVPVEAVRVLVVRHVHVEAAVAVEVGHHGAEAVLGLARVDAGELAHLAEPRRAAPVRSLVEVEEVAHPAVVRGEPRRTSRGSERSGRCTRPRRCPGGRHRSRHPRPRPACQPYAAMPAGRAISLKVPSPRFHSSAS